MSKYSRDEPPEVALIKAYVTDTFHAAAGISVSDNAITITVNSAALANALRLRTTALRDLCATDKRLVFRIG